MISIFSIFILFISLIAIFIGSDGVLFVPFYSYSNYLLGDKLNSFPTFCKAPTALALRTSRKSEMTEEEKRKYVFFELSYAKNRCGFIEMQNSAKERLVYL